MPFAARVGDHHAYCPVTPGTAPAHVGGQIRGRGEPTVKIGGQTAAVVGDVADCQGAPGSNSIVGGSKTVFIGGKGAARVGDRMAHGGAITSGLSTVSIGG